MRVQRYNSRKEIQKFEFIPNTVALPDLRIVGIRSCYAISEAGDNEQEEK